MSNIVSDEETQLNAAENASIEVNTFYNKILYLYLVILYL